MLNDPNLLPPRTACDLEQIHRIGAIQPHGALIAADQASLRIIHASENIATLTGHDPATLLGGDLPTLIASADIERLQTTGSVTAAGRALNPVTVRLLGPQASLLECLPHSHDDLLILELFPPQAPVRDGWQEDDLRRRIISDLVQPTTLDALAQLSADILRQVNGFDRVMIYRFADDNHGEVIAESTTRTDSYLGLHYPASDIPEPARRHFLQNAVRAIADINAPQVPVLGIARPDQIDAPGAIDLSFSVLRAVPSTHLQYLANMGVAASMSVSLVSNERLWGLIACHHYAPRRVPVQTLRFAELLGGTISALLQGIESRDKLGRAIEAEQTAFRMENQGRAGTALCDVVAGWAPDMMRLLDAQGMVLRQHGVVREFGDTPTPRLRYRALRNQLAEGVAATDHLASVIDLTPQQMEHAAGAGYMELSSDGQDYLVMLRSEYEQVVPWAGKPETIAEKQADGSTRLNPRASFAIWHEERRDRSRPFDTTDHEALRIIRRALFALNSLERERAALLAQKEAEAEEERLRLALLDAARKTSMGELASALAHELNQPLAAVTNYINACRAQLRGASVNLPDGFEALMLDAVSEASRASDLVRRLRDFIAGGALQLEECDLVTAVQQGADLAMLAHGSDRPELEIAFPDDLPRVWIDSIQIGQVILNLASNAITAMRGRDLRVLTISARRGLDRIELSVTDTGPGIPREQVPTLFEPFHSTTTAGMGIGLSLCRSIVEAHGGRIWAPDTGDGGRIDFTLPLNQSGGD